LLPNYLPYFEVLARVTLQQPFGKVSAINLGTGEGEQLGQRDGIMSCRDTIHLICWYLEGKLSPSVEGEIKKHLADCTDCQLVLNAANSTLDRYFSADRVEQAVDEIKAA
jgi:hypothetical protein